MDLWTEKLDLYIDGELPEAEERALAQHLRECLECTSGLARRVLLKREVRKAGMQYGPDNMFRERLRNQLAPGKRSVVRVWWTAGIAVLAIVAVVVVLSLPRSLPVELADLHVTALANANPVDVASSDRHTVKPWFQGKIPFTFNLPELEGSGFTLVGGRLVYVNQAPVAQLIYQVRQHRMSAFIMQQRDALKLPHGARNDHTFTTESWESGGLAYVIIADAAPADVQKLASMLRSAD